MAVRLTKTTSAADAQQSSARSVIDAHAGGGKLGSLALGRSLVDRKGALDVGLARDVLEDLRVGRFGNEADDVMLSMVKAASDDGLRSAARTPHGRQLLLQAVRELQAGPTMGDEADALRRVLGQVAEVSTPTMQGPNGETINVEVITFFSGGAVLDGIGRAIELLGAGALNDYVGMTQPPPPERLKGHTALVVGDLVYSFETDWQVGRTREEYLKDNDHRGAVIQRLDVTMDEARAIQAHANAAADTGVYGVSGDICTDAVASLLEPVIGKLDLGWDTQGFPDVLRDRGLVAREEIHEINQAQSDRDDVLVSEGHGGDDHPRDHEHNRDNDLLRSQERLWSDPDDVLVESNDAPKPSPLLDSDHDDVLAKQHGDGSSKMHSDPHNAGARGHSRGTSALYRDQDDVLNQPDGGVAFESLPEAEPFQSIDEGPRPDDAPMSGADGPS